MADPLRDVLSDGPDLPFGPIIVPPALYEDAVREGIIPEDSPHWVKGAQLEVPDWVAEFWAGFHPQGQAGE